MCCLYCILIVVYVRILKEVGKCFIGDAVMRYWDKCMIYFYM